MKKEQKIQNLKQLILILCCVFSLFVSSVSACACSHHHEKANIESADCHGHSEEANVEPIHKTNSAETNQTSFSESECFCAQTEPKLIAKSEKVKIEKQQAGTLPVLPARLSFFGQINPAKFDFIKPFYLTDSFYNLKPKRAPPIL